MGGILNLHKRRFIAESSGNGADPFLYDNYLEIRTTSTANNFQANTLSTSEDIKWVVSGDLPDAEYVEQFPVIDLSNNTGTATIHVYGKQNCATVTFVAFYSKLVTYAKLRGLVLTHMRFYSNQLQQLILEDTDVTNEFALQGEQNLQVVDVPPITCKTIQMLSSSSINTIDLTDYPVATWLRNNSGKIANINFDTVNGHPTITSISMDSNTVAPNFDLSLFPNVARFTSYSSNQTDTDFTGCPNIELIAIINSTQNVLTLPSPGNAKMFFIDIQSSTINTILNAAAHPLLRTLRVKNSALTVSQLNRLILDVRSNEFIASSREFDWGGLQPTRTEFVTDDVWEAWNWFINNGWDMKNSLMPI